MNSKIHKRGGSRPYRRGSAKRTLLQKIFSLKTFFVILALFALTALAGGGAAGFIFIKYSKDLPSLTAMKNYKPSLITTILDRHDAVVTEYFIEKRILRKLDAIPQNMVMASLAIEDDNFFSHRGIDIPGIARAALVNLRSRGVVQGGSTITQQVAKILFLTRERTFERKIKEALLSLKIERSFSKNEILEIYLNQIYYGHGAYGVEAASQMYFDKSVSELTLAEMALLAGLPKAPTNYSPFNAPEAAIKRRGIVIRRMEQLGYIGPEEARQAENEPLAIMSSARKINNAPFFAEHVRRYLEKSYGSTSLYREGLKVYTTLDLAWQKSAQEALKKGLEATDHRLGWRGPTGWVDPQDEEIDWESINPQKKNARGKNDLAVGERFRAIVRGVEPEEITVEVNGRAGIIKQPSFSWAHKPDARVDGRKFKPVENALTLVKPGDIVEVKILDNPESAPMLVALDQYPSVQGAILGMEYATGAIRSMVGGYDFETSKFNRAVQAYRQPGSAFKPIIYSAALDKGFSPSSVIIDSPVIFEDEIGEFKNWKPVNFKKRFHGPTTLRSAVTHSRNIVTIKVLRKIGIPYVVEYAKTLGIKSELDPNLSLALGASSVSLMELTSVYGVFANGGMRQEPFFIRKIEDRDGRVIEEHTAQERRVMPEDTAYLINNILQGVVREGTGRAVRSLNSPVAGKTGTTNDFMDAWFVGFTPDIVTGVWVGRDRKERLGKNETGSRSAAPIWLRYMKTVVKDLPRKPFVPPKNIVFVRADKKTGKLATPDSTEPFFEVFKEGSQPTEYAGHLAAPL